MSDRFETPRWGDEEPVDRDPEPVEDGDLDVASENVLADAWPAAPAAGADEVHEPSAPDSEPEPLVVPPPGAPERTKRSVETRRAGGSWTSLRLM